MALTFVTLQNHVLDFIDVDDATTLARVKDYINMAGRDVWGAYPWPERHAEATLTTLAPYSTGTVASSGATITGTGTTFPATYTAGLFRFATSYGAPFYTVTTRDSGTQLTLADSYAETALSGSTYVLWQDTYELASAVDTLVDVRLLKQGADGSLPSVLERRMDNQAYFAHRAGYPEVYAVVAPNATTGVKRVRLWPAPDAVYRLRYRYLKTYTDMSGDSDECVVPESRRDLLICGALRYGYALKDEYQKAQVEEQKFQALLRAHWQRERAFAPISARLQPFDQSVAPRDPYDISTLSIT